MDNIDKDILEFCANDEPWHILCGSMYSKVNKPEELIDRVLRLVTKGYLIISQPESYAQIAPTKETLLKFSKQHNWYEEEICVNDAWWDIKTTDDGFEYVRDRFSV